MVNGLRMDLGRYLSEGGMSDHEENTDSLAISVGRQNEFHRRGVAVLILVVSW